MQNLNEKRKELIACKQFERKNLFIINCYYELYIQNELLATKEVIFLEFYKGYNRNTKIAATFDNIALRGLLHACRELFTKKASKYKDFKDASLSNNSTSQEKKRILLSSLNEQYIIKIEAANDERTISFDMYSFLAFIDTLKILTDEIDACIFKVQRKIYKLNNKG